MVKTWESRLRKARFRRIWSSDRRDRIPPRAQLAFVPSIALLSSCISLCLSHSPPSRKSSTEALEAATFCELLQGSRPDNGNSSGGATGCHI